MNYIILHDTTLLHALIHFSYLEHYANIPQAPDVLLAPDPIHRSNASKNALHNASTARAYLHAKWPAE